MEGEDYPRRRRCLIIDRYRRGCQEVRINQVKAAELDATLCRGKRREGSKKNLEPQQNATCNLPPFYTYLGR